MSSHFSSLELEQIRNAVRESEKTTSAEIVPVFYERSGFYPDAQWKSGAMFSLIWSFLVYIYFRIYSLDWSPKLEFFFLSQMFMGVLGFLIAYFWKPWQRLFIERSDMKKRVWDKAQAVFLKEGVFQTKNRTGMLLFISFFEKEAVIIGDSGINRFVSPEVWQGIISQLVMGLKKGQKVEAIVKTIHSMGNLLKQYPIEANDENELTDELRFGGDN